MPTKLRCPECGEPFSLRPVDADRSRVPCPGCGAMVGNPHRDDPDDDFDDYDDRPRRRRPARRSSGAKTTLIALGVLALIALMCGGGLAWVGWQAVKPTDFPEQTQDYADARKGFKTTLTRQGPSPQDWQAETPPAGVEEVTFRSGDLRLKGWVNPPGGKAGGPGEPAVLFLHGGFAFGAEDWDQAKPFRDAGYVVMIPFLRGENGQPGNFTLFYDEVDDVLAAAEALAKTPGVDPNRLYVAGHSAGGTLAMLASMTAKRFRACASFSGSPDQVAFVRDEPGLVPFDPENRKELEMRSPLAFPKSFKCPARLYYGDEELPFRFSTERLAEKARAAGLDVQAVEVSGDHMTAVVPAMKQAIAFFRSK